MRRIISNKKAEIGILEIAYIILGILLLFLFLNYFIFKIDIGNAISNMIPSFLNGEGNKDDVEPDEITLDDEFVPVEDQKWIYIGFKEDFNKRTDGVDYSHIFEILPGEILLNLDDWWISPAQWGSSDSSFYLKKDEKVIYIKCSTAGIDQIIGVILPGGQVLFSIDEEVKRKMNWVDSYEKSFDSKYGKLYLAPLVKINLRGPWNTYGNNNFETQSNLRVANYFDLYSAF